MTLPHAQPLRRLASPKQPTLLLLLVLLGEFAGIAAFEEYFSHSIPSSSPLLVPSPRGNSHTTRISTRRGPRGDHSYFSERDLVQIKVSKSKKKWQEDDDLVPAGPPITIRLTPSGFYYPPTEGLLDRPTNADINFTPEPTRLPTSEPTLRPTREITPVPSRETTTTPTPGPTIDNSAFGDFFGPAPSLSPVSLPTAIPTATPKPSQPIFTSPLPPISFQPPEIPTVSPSPVTQSPTISSAPTPIANSCIAAREGEVYETPNVQTVKYNYELLTQSERLVLAVTNEIDKAFRKFLALDLVDCSLADESTVQGISAGLPANYAGGECSKIRDFDQDKYSCLVLEGTVLVYLTTRAAQPTTLEVQNLVWDTLREAINGDSNDMTLRRLEQDGDSEEVMDDDELPPSFLNETLGIVELYFLSQSPGDIGAISLSGGSDKDSNDQRDDSWISPTGSAALAVSVAVFGALGLVYYRRQPRYNDRIPMMKSTFEEVYESYDEDDDRQKNMIPLRHRGEIPVGGLSPPSETSEEPNMLSISEEVPPPSQFEPYGIMPINATRALSPNNYSDARQPRLVASNRTQIRGTIPVERSSTSSSHFPRLEDPTEHVVRISPLQYSDAKTSSTPDNMPRSVNHQTSDSSDGLFSRIGNDSRSALTAKQNLARSANRSKSPHYHSVNRRSPVAVTITNNGVYRLSHDVEAQTLHGRATTITHAGDSSSQKLEDFRSRQGNIEDLTVMVSTDGVYRVTSEESRRSLSRSRTPTNRRISALPPSSRDSSRSRSTTSSRTPPVGLSLSTITPATSQPIDQSIGRSYNSSSGHGETSSWSNITPTIQASSRRRRSRSNSNLRKLHSSSLDPPAQRNQQSPPGLSSSYLSTNARIGHLPEAQDSPLDGTNDESISRQDLSLTGMLNGYVSSVTNLRNSNEKKHSQDEHMGGFPITSAPSQQPGMPTSSGRHHLTSANLWTSNVDGSSLKEDSDGLDAWASGALNYLSQLSPTANHCGALSQLDIDPSYPPSPSALERGRSRTPVEASTNSAVRRGRSRSPVRSSSRGRGSSARRARLVVSPYSRGGEDVDEDDSEDYDDGGAYFSARQTTDMDFRSSFATPRGSSTYPAPPSRGRFVEDTVEF